VSPEDGVTKYYFNKETQESVWEKPADFNPGSAGASRGGAGAGTKGPPGANLFVVRKLRREEYDEFNDMDLREAFGKYGEVMRCEMSIDSATGWSKGFGFVSFADPTAADAAIGAMNGSWLAGKQMKARRLPPLIDWCCPLTRPALIPVSGREDQGRQWQLV